MENNRYAQHKKEIKEISERENVDIGTACAILRHDKGWVFDGIDKEITAFCDYINSMEPAEFVVYFSK